MWRISPVVKTTRARNVQPFKEGTTKTWQWGLWLQSTSEPHKTLPTVDSQCPVPLFKSYLAKKREHLKLSGPFYLAFITNPNKTDGWYKKSRLGKNTISTIMANMKENLPLKEMYPYKRLAVHSNWKTVLRTLKAHRVPGFHLL